MKNKPDSETGELAVRPPSASVPVIREVQGLAAQATPSGITVTNGFRGQAIQIRPKQITVGGNRRMIDPYQLMAMIKNVTQTIGEYKGMDNAYGDFVVGGLRKVRRDMVAQLESNFNLHWSLDDNGESVFYM